MHDDDPEVQALVSKMNSAQLSLEASIQHLGEVAGVISVLAKAVEIGTELAGKAVPI
jgi:hypothetical protein